MYLGIVDAVDAAAGRARVAIGHLRVLTPFVRCAAPLGLVGALPEVGDEVLVMQCGPAVADCVIVAWLPTAAQAAAAADHPLIASEAGGVPTQTDPSANVGNARTAAVLAR